MKNKTLLQQICSSFCITLLIVSPQPAHLHVAALIHHPALTLETWESYLVSSNISLEKAMAPTPVLLPGKSHGRRSLVGCNPQGHEESDTTERLHFHFSLSCIGEGNGNPLKCSCLENLVDRGAWPATVHGVMKVKSESEVAQLCPTLSNPMDCSPPGSSVHGTFQARVLEWWGVPSPSPKHTDYYV